MDNKCAIVRDLLPSYIDELCSKESREFIEEHIGFCEICKTHLDGMNREVVLHEELHINERLKEIRPFKKLSLLFTSQKKFNKLLIIFAISSFALGLYYLSNSFIIFNKNKEEIGNIDIIEQEKEAIMNEVFTELDEVDVVTEQGASQFIDIFDKYHNQLNLLAVFPATNIEDWVEENKHVGKKPTTIYPIDYQKATIVIGSDGVVENKGLITPSGYDLGTVVMANEEWVVQYEYKKSYEKILEKYHQLKYYGPSNLSFFQFPILFFTVSMVLGTVWLFLKKQNGKLKGVIE
ncbi:zf-HC2 domain-containing protein [Bacillus sp. BGMRC 2118]|nr:zf-HC2 domain-containing protein [Bacillus sp. BGMRC 2118]